MKKLSIVLSILACVLSFSLAANSFASEGDQMKGSSTSDEEAIIAIDGFCPVCVFKGVMVKGKPKFSTEYKGKVYYFPGFEQQKMFINDPESYIADLEKKYKKLKGQSMGSDKGSGAYKGSH